MNTLNEQKTEVLRARVEPSFKRDVRMLAQFNRLEESDIVRIAVAKLIERVKSAGGMLNVI